MFSVSSVLLGKHRLRECQMAVFGKGGFSTYPSVTCKCVPRCRDAKPPTHLCFPLWFFPKGRLASAPMVPDNVLTHCRCRKTAICKTAIWHHPIDSFHQNPKCSKSARKVDFIKYWKGLEVGVRTWELREKRWNSFLSKIN